MTENPEVLFGGVAPMLSLIDGIYACASDTSLWPEVLERIADAVRGESLALFARFPETVLLAKAHIGDDAWGDFTRHYASLNPIAPRADLFYGDNVPRYSQAVISDSELEGTEFYNDFFRRNDMHHAVGISVSITSDMPSADFSCQRPKRKGVFGPEEGAVLQVLMPHLRRSLMLSQSMEKLQAVANGMGAVATLYDHAIFGISAEGRIIFQSEPAEALLRERALLRLRSGRLTLPQAEENERLQHLIRGAAGMWVSGGAAAGGTMTVSREPLPPIHITVSPFHRDDVMGFNRVAALITVSDPTQAPLSRAAIMKSLFRLTPVEIRMADMLQAGKDTRESAELLRITFETARFHVKRLLQKTGTKRQIELIRLMSSLPGTPVD